MAARDQKTSAPRYRHPLGAVPLTSSLRETFDSSLCTWRSISLIAVTLATMPRATKSASTAQPRRRGGSSSDDQCTRRKLIEAAIQTILEQGFYRASSNAIAGTAGLSWGVIQYYFGSRENLMLAVLEEGTRRLSEDLAEADLTGETLTERFDQYFRVLERYYGSIDYLAFVQVVLNLSRDPRTSDQARQTMLDARTTVDAEVRRLTNKLFAGTKVRRAALRSRRATSRTRRSCRCGARSSTPRRTA